MCPHLLSVLQSECEQSLARSLYLNKPTLQCVWSGKSINKKTLDVDHALPFSVCRNNDLWNLLPANRTLNQKQKRDLIPSPGFIMRQQDKIIDNWQFIHGSEPELFDFEVARAIGESLSSGWENKLLAHLKLGCNGLIKLNGVMTLLHDPTRRLPATDPFHRQLTIGLGCFLEQMAIAASILGYRVETTLFPEGSSAELLGDKAVARAQFVHDSAIVDPLFAQIPHRRSTKEPFDLSQPVAAALLSELSPEVPKVRFDGTVDSARVAVLKELIWEAWVTEYSTPTAHQAMAKSGETVQMLGRLGYAAPVPQTPRWSLDDKIKHT